MILTKEFILSGASEAGGWNRPQLLLLGVKWPPAKGWMNRVIGRMIPDEDARDFLELKGWLSPRTKKRYAKARDRRAQLPLSIDRKLDADALDNLRERDLI